MITHKELKKAGWKRDSSNDYIYRMDNYRMHILIPIEYPQNPEYLIERLAGRAGTKWDYNTIFHGRLSSILELEHIMHWTGIK